MFDGLAPSYDLLNHLLSLGIDRGWRRRAIGMLSLGVGDRVLDVATGTGDFALELAKRTGCRVEGVDLSEEMLARGRLKVQDAGLDHQVTLRCGNAEQLPEGDGEFEAVTVAFGARNFAHLEQGLLEMARVLKMGGQLLVLEFSQPSNAVWGKLFDVYFAHVLPRIGGWIGGDRAAYEYLHNSAKAFPSGTLFEDILRSAHLQPTRTLPLTGGVATAYLCRKP